MPKILKARQARTNEVDIASLPEPITTADRIVLEIRKFIASAIFFNTQAAGKVGLGLTDMQLMHLVQLYGAMTPSRLGVLSGLSSGGVTVVIDRLEKAGFVRRIPNPDDRRSLLVTLVPARLQKLDDIYGSIESGTRRELAKLPQKDLEAVVRFFEAMGAARD